MIKSLTAISAAALFGVALASAQTSSSTSDSSTSSTKIDTSSNHFTELDKDTDGRLSTTEAAADPALAAAFTRADMNHDSYLSPDEMKAAGSSSSGY